MDDVVDAVVVVFPPEAVPSELRRFIVGRSESSLVGVLVVPEAVVESGLSVVWVDAVSVLVFEPKCGWFASFDVAMTGKVLDGFNAAAFRGTDRGLTLP